MIVKVVPTPEFVPVFRKQSLTNCRTRCTWRHRTFYRNLFVLVHLTDLVSGAVLPIAVSVGGFFVDGQKYHKNLQVVFSVRIIVKRWSGIRQIVEKSHFS